ncbi:MAG: SH3 domain-containing protein [Gemmatimonadota bacterium]|nr:MAG: SH3 domain-containing protein [Gemmatimonadota bacterium]
MRGKPSGDSLRSAWLRAQRIGWRNLVGGVVLAISVVILGLVLRGRPEPADDLETQASWVTVLASELNVRNGPSTREAVIGTVTRGQKPKLLDCRGSWCLVDLADSATIDGVG